MTTQKSDQLQIPGPKTLRNWMAMALLLAPGITQPCTYAQTAGERGERANPTENKHITTDPEQPRDRTPSVTAGTPNAGNDTDKIAKNDARQNPFAFDYSGAAPPSNAEAAIEEVNRAILRENDAHWKLDTEGFVRRQYRNLWTRLRLDHNLHGFVQLGVGTHDFWETRIGLGLDLVPDKVHLGLEAATGKYPCDWE